MTKTCKKKEIARYSVELFRERYFHKSAHTAQNWEQNWNRYSVNNSNGISRTYWDDYSSRLPSRVRLKRKESRYIRNPAVVCNADAMHSSRRIMQTTSSRDNHRTSEREGEGYSRCIKENKLFKRHTRGRKAAGKLYSSLDNRFSRYARNFAQEGRQQHVRHVMLTSHEICITLNERAKFPRNISCTRRDLFHDRIEILDI